MLRYARNSDYRLPPEQNNTKYWQERFLVETLPQYVTPAAHILEIGANKNLKILRTLDVAQRWIADPYDARGLHVCAQPPDFGADIIISRCEIGISSNALPSSYFDLIYSSSVLEHIGQRETNFDTRYTPTPPEVQEIPRRAFCQECFRLLKPAGVTLHTIDHGVRNISFDQNFRWAGFEALDPSITFARRTMLDDPDALRQLVSWHNHRTPLPDGVAKLNTVIAIGYRKPIGAATTWPALPRASKPVVEPPVVTTIGTPRHFLPRAINKLRSIAGSIRNTGKGV
jgi:SAM-dependent methyltransferase